MNSNILHPLKLQAAFSGLPSTHKRIQKAVRLALLALASMATFAVANAVPPATHSAMHNEQIKKKCYCARSSDSADRVDLNGGALHFNPIDGEPIR
jgi:hypothetical protein